MSSFTSDVPFEQQDTHPCGVFHAYSSDTGKPDLHCWLSDVSLQPQLERFFESRGWDIPDFTPYSSKENWTAALPSFSLLSPDVTATTPHPTIPPDTNAPAPSRQPGSSSNQQQAHAPGVHTQRTNAPAPSFFQQATGGNPSAPAAPAPAPSPLFGSVNPSSTPVATGNPQLDHLYRMLDLQYKQTELQLKNQQLQFQQQQKLLQQQLTAMQTQSTAFATATTSADKAKITMQFPVWDGDEETKAEYLEALDTYLEQKFFSSVTDFTQVTPATREQSAHLRSELLRTLPRKLRGLFSFNDAYKKDQFSTLEGLCHSSN